MDKDKGQTNTGFTGRENRVFERNPVEIDAVITSDALWGEVRCKIRDVCIGGMLLVDESEASSSAKAITETSLNDVIKIRFMLPSTDGHAETSCRFAARIVRVDADSAGVAFVNPDMEALKALMDYVKSSTQAAQGSKSRQAGFAGQREDEYEKIAHQCCALVKDSLEPLASTTIEAIIKQLFELSKSTKDTVEQNSYFSALEILNRLKKQLVENFVSSAKNKLGSHSLVKDVPHEQDVSEVSLGDMALVEEETLDNWLADTGTIEATERAHSESLNALYQRLSVIFGVKVESKNNPFGPSLFSRSFQDAIQGIGLRHNVNLFAYKVFKGILIDELSELYAELNELLVKNDILPEIKYSLPTRKPRRKTTTKDDSEQEMGEVAESNAPAGQVGGGGQGGSQGMPAGSGTGDAGDANAPAGQAGGGGQGGSQGMPAGSGTGDAGDANAPAGQAGGGGQGGSQGMPAGSGTGGDARDANAPAGQAGGGGQGGSQGMPATANADEGAPSRHGRPQLPETEQDIYALVDELHHLRERLGTADQHAHRLRPGQETNTKSVNRYLAEETSADDVMDSPEQHTQAEKILFTQSEVLNALANVEQNITQLDRSEIRKGIAAALRRSSGGAEKAVAGREERIINVSTSIFDTMLSDLQVPINMREWLARLEMPVLKMAIHDDSLYKDSDHLVRQVVNKIAKLGMLVGEEETEGQTGIRNALDWLINLINTDFDGSDDVFKRVSDQLDVLVQAQDKKYKENIHKVVEYIDANKEDLPVDEELEEQEEQDDEVVLKEWNRRAKRLSEDDWILFDVNTDNPIRLKVAWIAEHSRKVVFVDAEGNKNRILPIDSLSQSLSLGNAQTIDDANTPTMDRAQYATLQKLNRDLIYQSTHDPLTGLINRREFEKQLTSAFAESRGAGVQHAVCFLDIDQFKVINSNLGNAAGDELLVQMADWMNASFEELEKVTIARLGSDEFGVIFHECALEDALALAEELIEQVSQQKLEWQDQHISVTVSLGLTQVSEYSQDISSIMQAAESSCDIAKQTGGNRLQLYYASNAKLNQRKGIISWVTKIDDILDGDGLQLRCQRIQPIGNEEGVIEHVHYEILLGLKSDRDDLPSIQEFIEAAEYSNRIGHIDRWVVKTAIKWISENDQVLDIVNVFSINLSGKSLSDEQFIDFVLAQIEENNVPAECLCFEITETAGVENLSDAAYFINTIKETGCGFSLDDFGSGMSSYAYLRDLPVDYLKIDGMFIKNIHNSESDYAVVKSITEVAHFMNKRVIAEYVENDEIVTVLQKIGVDFAQGYGVEKPHLIEELV